MNLARGPAPFFSWKHGSILASLLIPLALFDMTSRVVFKPAMGWSHLYVWIAQGQPAHPDSYPEGWFCTPKGTYKNGRQTTEHPCKCKRIDHDPMCEGIPIEHAICEQWCHKQHCNCPIVCEPVQPESTGIEC